MSVNVGVPGRVPSPACWSHASARRIGLWLRSFMQISIKSCKETRLLGQHDAGRSWIVAADAAALSIFPDRRWLMRGALSASADARGRSGAGPAGAGAAGRLGAGATPGRPGHRGGPGDQAVRRDRLRASPRWASLWPISSAVCALIGARLAGRSARRRLGVGRFRPAGVRDPAPGAAAAAPPLPVEAGAFRPPRPDTAPARAPADRRCRRPAPRGARRASAPICASSTAHRPCGRSRSRRAGRRPPIPCAAISPSR
jgi:hypothetical protein